MMLQGLAGALKMLLRWARTKRSAVGVPPPVVSGAPVGPPSRDRRLRQVPLLIVAG